MKLPGRSFPLFVAASLSGCAGSSTADDTTEAGTDNAPTATSPTSTAGSSAGSGTSSAESTASEAPNDPTPAISTDAVGDPSSDEPGTVTDGVSPDLGTTDGDDGSGGSSEGSGGVTSVEEPGAGGTLGSGAMPGRVDGGAGGGSFVGGTPVDEPLFPALDCGQNGTALEDHGPSSNRLNYVIVGDGYSAEELEPGGTLDQHLEAAMAKRFSDPVGQPFLRYRRFINICVLRIPSGPICGQSEFGCCGDDTSRLANCDNAAVNSAISANLPPELEVDWRAVVLNGSSWWNSGGTLMMWSGGNQDAGGAALHEGGHGHNFISDEYGNCELSRVSREATYGVNVSLTDQMTDGRWDDWLGYDQNPGTGEQGLFACEGGQTWRPSENSMMNSLFGDDPNTSYNPVSREKIVLDIWRVVESPYDATSPEPGEVTDPETLTVHVIDPDVISVDWTLDGELIATDGGPSYDVAAADLAAGTHTVTARAYDNADTDLVRQVPGTTFNRQYWGSGDMGHSDKTVTWTVTIE